MDVSESSAFTDSAASSRMKLPKFQLPTFTGSYTDWISFYDLFKVSVDSNFLLSNSDKLRYFKACVRCETARLTSWISTIDAYYNIALTLLKDRSEIKWSTIQAYLRAIWPQPVLEPLPLLDWETLGTHQWAFTSTCWTWQKSKALECYFSFCCDPQYRSKVLQAVAAG